MKTHSCLLLVLVLLFLRFSGPLFSAQYDIPPPTGSGAFGTQVKMLSNGNFVVTDPYFDDGATVDVGAVYLYSSAGALISTLKGSQTNDLVGVSGIRVVKDGNFLVFSPEWRNGTVASAGAVTWVDGSAGLNAAVSAANSLVGSTTNDRIGTYYASPDVLVLTNGNYIIRSLDWDNGAAANAGAVTWGNGEAGTVGVISAANSIVGSHANDQIATNMYELTNGHAVISSWYWDNGVTNDVGAATWMSGYSATVGAVTPANSLVGSSAADMVGLSGVTALTNGCFVVASRNWNNGAVADVGAVTWSDGFNPLVGTVSAANSLIGSVAGDKVGITNPTALTNGNYVVISTDWNNGAALSAGAVTWCDGSTGRVGTVSASNSLVGSHTDDAIGNMGVTALTNGHYVVCSHYWDNGTLQNAGAATWGSGTVGVAGAVSPFNSLIGARDGAYVGNGGVKALTNGHYVVSSYSWSDDTSFSLGAVTWGNGSTGITGNVSAQNSMVGSHTGDQVGVTQVLTLSNGNYVVFSPFWDNGTVMDAGAVTWANGNTGFKGVVSAANSLVGAGASDRVGNYGVALTQGNYVITSFSCFNGSDPNRGATTWGNGTTGITGLISPANSLIGSNAASGVIPLANGNYVAFSPFWSSTTADACGALTFGNGATGISGSISVSNSIIGNREGDNIGASVTDFSDGSYALRCDTLDSATAQDSGAMIYVTKTALTGNVGAGNGLLGSAAAGGPQMQVDHDPVRDHSVISLPADNKVRYFADSGRVSFDAPLFQCSENDGPLILRLTRSGGALGAMTVYVSTSSTGGTAKPGIDYTPLTNQPVFFPTGVTTVTAQVPVTTDADFTETNETFTVKLSGDALDLGSRTTAIARINEAGDSKLPSPPVITAPASGAHLPVNPGGSISVSGAASDDRSVSYVAVSLNGGPFNLADLSVNGSKATWTTKVTPVTGLNTLRVICLDSANNTSPTTTQTFFVSRPLVVKTVGGTATLTSGYSPSSFRDVGRLCTITAKPAAGFIFANWSLSGGATASEIGVTANDLELPTLTFIYKEGVQLTANVVPSPYLVGSVAGLYNGLVTANPFLPDRAPTGYGPEDGTGISNSTDGYLTVTVGTSGAFTGKLNIDGVIQPVAGDFDHVGDARFGASRSRSFTISRPGKSSLVVSLKMDITPLASTISGTVIDVGTGTSSALSDVFCDFAYFNGTSRLVPANYLGTGNANGFFTTAFPTVGLGSQPPDLTAADYPQGDGIANITVTKGGLVSLVGTLADGSPATASGTLNSALFWRLYIQLYNKRGYLRSDVLFDHTQTDSDLKGFLPVWLRPIQDSQHYPKGWPHGINVGVVGAKFAATLGSSALPGLTPPPFDANGNASLVFGDGLLTETVGISQTDVVQNLPADTGFKLSIDRKTGQFSGPFTIGGTKPAFKGILLPKGPTPYGTGFYLTPAPTVKDYTGQSNRVRLTPQ